MPHCGRSVRDEAASGIHREADKSGVVGGFQGAARTHLPRTVGGRRAEDSGRRARCSSETAERSLKMIYVPRSDSCWNQSQDEAASPRIARNLSVVVVV